MALGQEYLLEALINKLSEKFNITPEQIKIASQLPAAIIGAIKNFNQALDNIEGKIDGHTIRLAAIQARLNPEGASENDFQTRALILAAENNTAPKDEYMKLVSQTTVPS